MFIIVIPCDTQYSSFYFLVRVFVGIPTWAYATYNWSDEKPEFSRLTPNIFIDCPGDLFIEMLVALENVTV